jgi:hypothetical protein
MLSINSFNNSIETPSIKLLPAQYQNLWPGKIIDLSYNKSRDNVFSKTSEMPELKEVPKRNWEAKTLKRWLSGGTNELKFSTSNLNQLSVFECVKKR